MAALTTQIEQITDDKDKRHLLYNQLGATQVKLGNDLEAIAAYEASVKDKEEFGDAYNALLNLYETQRKQAAKAKMMTTFKNGSQNGCIARYVQTGHAVRFWLLICWEAIYYVQELKAIDG